MDAESTVRSYYGTFRTDLSEQTATPWRPLGMQASVPEAGG
ncbi:hypothetical protein [Natronomonas aquatica]|jgi:hypothetical protein|nr:hypothetical protein [Natronomonas aquatica]